MIWYTTPTGAVRHRSLICARSGRPDATVSAHPTARGALRNIPPCGRCGDPVLVAARMQQVALARYRDDGR